MSDTAPAFPPRGEAYYRLALILGALTAIGPLAIDMYLPSLPTIAREFASSAAAVQASLAAYYIGIAIGQALYGPLSDRVGRKPALYLGLSVFFLSSIVCAMAASTQSLVAFLFLQALGVCAPIAVAKHATAMQTDFNAFIVL